MNTDLVFLVEMGLVFGLVLAFAVWELVKLRRERNTGAERPKRTDPADQERS